MSTRDDGGPAFPIPDQRDADGNGICQGPPGMSLRDWFAGQALGGCIQISAPATTNEKIALTAYALADAMLKERERTP